MKDRAWHSPVNKAPQVARQLIERYWDEDEAGRAATQLSLENDLDLHTVIWASPRFVEGCL